MLYKCTDIYIYFDYRNNIVHRTRIFPQGPHPFGWSGMSEGGVRQLTVHATKKEVTIIAFHCYTSPTIIQKAWSYSRQSVTLFSLYNLKFEIDLCVLRAILISNFC